MPRPHRRARLTWRHQRNLPPRLIVEDMEQRLPGTPSALHGELASAESSPVCMTGLSNDAARAPENRIPGLQIAPMSSFLFVFTDVQKTLP